MNVPKSELDEAQIRELEQYEISQGPLSVLQQSVRNHTQVLISLRNNKKLLARVKAFDRHSNMVLENVKEMWTEVVRCPALTPAEKQEQEARQRASPLRSPQKDRFISKMFLRGDSVVLGRWPRSHSPTEYCLAVYSSRAEQNPRGSAAWPVRRAAAAAVEAGGPSGVERPPQEGGEGEVHWVGGRVGQDGPRGAGPRHAACPALHRRRSPPGAPPPYTSFHTSSSTYV